MRQEPLWILEPPVGASVPMGVNDPLQPLSRTESRRSMWELSAPQRPGLDDLDISRPANGNNQWSH